MAPCSVSFGQTEPPSSPRPALLGMLPAGLAAYSDDQARKIYLDRGFHSLMFLAQAFGEHRVSDPVHLAVVTDGLQEVAGEAVVAPERAAVFGPSVVIPQEYPNISCRAIDVIPPMPGTAAERSLIDEVLMEFHRTAAAPAVAFRGPHRWVRTYEPARLAHVSGDVPARLRNRGVYLITGGLGGIGLTLAEYLAKVASARLILVSRTALPEREAWAHWLDTHDESDTTGQRIRKVQALEALGAEVILLIADVADTASLRQGLARVREHFGRIDGVIHAAGVAGGGMIQLRTREASANVMAAKVHGTSVLMSLLAEDPPDFFVLCSSILSVVGQADYCGANASLDAFARSRQRGTEPPWVVSISWDVWQEVGMAVTSKVPEALRARREEHLKNGMRPAEGVEAFARILSSSLSEVVVSTRDLLALTSARRPPLPLHESCRIRPRGRGQCTSGRDRRPRGWRRVAPWRAWSLGSGNSFLASSEWASTMTSSSSVGTPCWPRNSWPGSVIRSASTCRSAVCSRPGRSPSLPNGSKCFEGSVRP